MTLAHHTTHSLEQAQRQLRRECRSFGLASKDLRRTKRELAKWHREAKEK